MRSSPTLGSSYIRRGGRTGPPARGRPGRGTSTARTAIYAAGSTEVTQHRRAPTARGRPPTHRGPTDRHPTTEPASPRERFLQLDHYRAEREWNRYEGTAQRDLFRELRTRFLQRHAAQEGWVVDVGSGPGRFAPVVGGPAARRVLVDLSLEMLREARRRLRGTGSITLLRADGASAPLRPGRFSEVVVLGNPIGFAGDRAEETLAGVGALVAPGGVLLLESVAGSGERSRYLSRLPPGAVHRLLAAPANLIRARVEREGYRPEATASPARAAPFRRIPPTALLRSLEAGGLHVEETIAVAPGLGADAERISAVRPDPSAWRRLLELEELLGRAPARWDRAAALLVAARRTAGAPASRAGAAAPRMPEIK
jgi:SAM-dependent methyltransferase